jgi:quercetin dioxygenase-like cupin family protein
MFNESTGVEPVLMLEGIERRTLTYGENMLLVEFTVRAGAVFPEHAHTYEQIGYLCKGAGKLWIGEECREIAPGSSWCIPGNVTHKAEFSEDSVALDIFHPVREDYLPD